MLTGCNMFASCTDISICKGTGADLSFGIKFELCKAIVSSVVHLAIVEDSIVVKI
jgi:hypothetical protein